jgi:hypothetical protein
MNAPHVTTPTAPWDADRLRDWLAQFYEGESIVVLANR